MNRDAASYARQMVDFGTMLQVTLTPHERGVEAKISFESSRSHGEGTDEEMCYALMYLSFGF